MPFTENFKIEQLLAKIGIKSNDTLFSDERRERGKEFQITLTWHQDLNKHLFDYMSTAVKFEQKDTAEPRKEGIHLKDCLREFKQSETLDEENMWYCNKCKDHVQATKTLEIFKVPRIMIISLKRFKTSRSKYGFGGGQKLDTQVDFPIENLDMSDFVLSKKQKESEKLIYDLYAVSNHYGSVGFGHYTAYGKNPLTNEWLYFDDSSVSNVSDISSTRSQIVSGAAYNLFYRRRDHADLNNLDFKAMELTPDPAFLDAQNNQKRS